MAADDERYLPEPPKRSIFARILAVLALAGTVVILYLVISTSTSSDDEPADENTRVEKEESKSGPETPEEYVVADGDSISVIAEKYGISVERIERLNPDLDPNTLATGLVIKLQK
jgi:LysM repeat protein